MKQYTLEQLEEDMTKELEKKTFTPYLVPFWVESIMNLVKEWAEKNYGTDRGNH